MKYNYQRTSVKQIPAAMRDINWRSGTFNLDLGGGKFDLATKFLKTKEVTNIIYDPYCGARIKLLLAMAYGIRDGYDTVTLLNVLNVIPTRKERLTVLRLALVLKKRLGKLYVSVYSGDRSGKPSVSKYNTWQANRELEWFLPEIKKVFGERGVWLVRKRHIKYYVVY